MAVGRHSRRDSRVRREPLRLGQLAAAGSRDNVGAGAYMVGRVVAVAVRGAMTRREVQCGTSEPPVALPPGEGGESDAGVEVDGTAEPPGTVVHIDGEVGFGAEFRHEVRNGKSVKPSG